MATTTVGLIASAVAEGAKVWNHYLVTADKKKAEECKEAAREYIQVDKREDTYVGITDERAEKLKRHFRKRFEVYYR